MRYIEGIFAVLGVYNVLAWCYRFFYWRQDHAVDALMQQTREFAREYAMRQQAERAKVAAEIRTAPLTKPPVV